MKESVIQIDLGDAQYPVFIGSSIVSKITSLLGEEYLGTKYYVIIDANINKLYGASLAEGLCVSNDDFFVIDAGKDNKTFNTAMNIFADLDANNIARDSIIVAVGGGVIGDIGGFVASCWYRGTRLVHVPTTLLSAVDSSLGGKTAINFKNTVNAVGTYHHPIAIVVDTNLLMSLPKREISSGFGEIIKYAAIDSLEIKSQLNNINNLSEEELSWFIGKCLLSKQKFVSNDIKEGSKRLFLNFGHTIGHAIEFSTVYDGKETLRHGEGVALGMIAVFKIASHLGYLSQKDMDWLITSCRSYGLPTEYDAAQLHVNKGELVNRIVKLAFKDKKRIKKVLRLILLQKLGAPFIYETNDESLIRKGIMAVIV